MTSPGEQSVFTARGVAATWRVAAQVAARLPRGGVVALQGELGAGKTTFVQGIAQALGITRPVTSPTFTLVGEYPGKALLLVHMDLYRLRSADDLLAIGFQEYLEQRALVAVEWPERAAELLPPETIWVRITLTGEPNTRRIEVKDACPTEACTCGQALLGRAGPPDPPPAVRKRSGKTTES